MQYDKVIATSISSDDTLFDFDTTLNKIRRLSGVDDQLFMRLTREHFTKKYPHMSGVEQATVVAMFMIAPMDFKRYAETLDILGVKLSLVMDVPMGHLRVPEVKVDPSKAAIETFFAKPISSMELTVRLTNILENSGEIHTYGDLVKSTRDKIAKIQYLGPKFLKELDTAMKEHGLIFGMYTPEDELSNLPLSVRVAALLKETGFTHISQLVGTTVENLQRIPNFTKKDIQHLASVLATRNIYLKMKPADAISNKDNIDVLGLTIRTSNCLKADHIYFIGDLVGFKGSELLKLPNFGRRSLNELREKMAAKGLDLKPE